MDFHQLRVFVEVAKQKNFSRAAESIFLSQPTVSAHIKALENEIGAPLFDRSQRELMLTEGGKILFKFAQEILKLKKTPFGHPKKLQYCPGAPGDRCQQRSGGVPFTGSPSLFQSQVSRYYLLCPAAGYAACL